MTAAIVLALGAPPARADSGGVPSIVAAADLNAALPDVAKRFTQKTGKSVNLIFGSSGAFTEQILSGATFEVFFSADESYVETLAAAGRTEGQGDVYAIGGIGPFLPNGSTITSVGDLRGLGPAIKDKNLVKFAIANPEHSPYGRAAKEALTNAGLWDSIKDHLVLGENVAQATQFALSGSTQGGIIPQSPALTPKVQAAGNFWLIPAQMHAQLRQRAVLIKGAGETARPFFSYIQTPEARAILKRYGFAPPGQKD